MIKSISYKISVAKLNFHYRSFASNTDLTLVPDIIVDIIYPEFEAVRDVKVYYTRNGFIVRLDTSKLSLKRHHELEQYINRNKEFLDDFEEFMKDIKNCRKVGYSVVEEDNI